MRLIRAHYLFLPFFLNLFFVSLGYCQLPDLTITAREYNSDPMSPGERRTFGYDKCNLGNVGTPSINVGFYLSKDQFLDEKDLNISIPYRPGVSANKCSFDKVSIAIPAATTPGSYFLIYKIDALNAVEEENEDNNLAFHPIAIIGAADLSVNLSLSPVDRGSLLGLTTIVKNNSPYPTAITSVNFYFSLDSVLDIKDSLILTDKVTSISGSDSLKLNNSVTTPINEIREYYIIALVDPVNGIEEVNENNNSDYQKVKLITPLLDLLPGNFKVISDSIHSGFPYKIEFDILNVGFEDAYYSSAAIYLSTDSILDSYDSKVDEIFIWKIAGESHLKVHRELIGQAIGSSYVIIWADNKSEVEESNEFNNQLHKKVNAKKAKIDLAIASARVGGDSVTNGDSLTIGFEEINLGYYTHYFHSSEVYLSTDTILDKYDHYLWGSNIDSIEVEQRLNFETTVRLKVLTPGLYYVIFKIDEDDRLNEDNEFNNIAFKKINILKPPYDLVLLNPKVDSIKENSVNVSCRLFNLKSNWIPENSVMYYFSKDSILDNNDTALLIHQVFEANDSSIQLNNTVTWTLEMEPGDYYILFKADFYNKVKELNEQNNIGYVKVAHPASSLDLQIRNFKANTNKILPGAILQTSFLKTKLDSTSYLGYHLDYFLSKDSILDIHDKYVFNKFLYSSFKDSIIYHSFNIPIETTPGEYFIILNIDHPSSIPESNNLNNTSLIKIEVVPLMDLQIKNFTLGTSSLFPNSTVIATLKINSLLNALNKDLSTSYFLSVDQVYDSLDVFLSNQVTLINEPIDSFEVISTLRIPSESKRGTYYIVAFSDYPNDIYETDENNNTALAKIEIGEAAVTGSIIWENWKEISGNSINSLTKNINFPHNPSATNYLNVFKSPENIGDNYGSRIRGYIYPPATGTYTFWISGDDNCELYISSDEKSTNKRKIAKIKGYTRPEEWEKYKTQKSSSVYLVAGEKYYIEALHKEGRGHDHISVGWKLPDGKLERPIPGARLSPFSDSTETQSLETAEADIIQDDIRIFPNPTSHKAEVEFYAKKDGEITINIIDQISSKFLFKERISKGKNNVILNLVSLKSGIYTLHLVLDGKIITKRIIVFR